MAINGKGRIRSDTGKLKEQLVREIDSSPMYLITYIYVCTFNTYIPSTLVMVIIIIICTHKHTFS